MMQQYLPFWEEKLMQEEQDKAVDYIIALGQGKYALDQTTAMHGAPIGQATHPVLDLKYWFKLGVGKQSEARSGSGSEDSGGKRRRRRRGRRRS